MFSDSALKNRLGEKAVVYWQVQEFLTFIATTIILGSLWGCANYWQWPSWLENTFIVLLVLSVISTYVSLCIIRKKFQHWTYEYDAHFFFIREGILTKRLIMLPFEKIQSVILLEGPLLNQFGLATIELQGIEKVYRIPALDRQVASTVQKELAHLTRRREEIDDETIASTHCL